MLAYLYIRSVEIIALGTEFQVYRWLKLLRGFMKKYSPLQLPVTEWTRVLKLCVAAMVPAERLTLYMVTVMPKSLFPQSCDNDAFRHSYHKEVYSALKLHSLKVHSPKRYCSRSGTLFLRLCLPTECTLAFGSFKSIAMKMVEVSDHFHTRSHLEKPMRRWQFTAY